MKNNGFVNNVNYSGIGLESVQISSNMSGKLLQQLSNNLYNKPHESAFREIAANMQDAFDTLDRGFKADIEYIDEEKKLIFRDYGVGMSHDTVINTYFTKGNSVKTNSEDSLGGFGIGMLSICSVSKISTIHTYFEGYKNSYLLVNVADTISYKHIGTVQEEGVGTEIILNLDTSKKKIEEKLEAALYFFSGINYINLHVNNIDTIPPIFENEDMYITDKNTTYYNYGHIVLGTTLYAYNLSACGLNTEYIYLKFKPSELEPSLNKEDIRDIPENTDVITAKCRKVYQYVMEEMNNHYVSDNFSLFCKNYLNPHPYAKLLPNFRAYIKGIVSKYFRNDQVYMLGYSANKKLTEDYLPIISGTVPVYYCSTPSICNKRKAYLESVGIYKYYVVKGNNNYFKFNDYNDVSKITIKKGDKVEVMACTQIIDGKKISIPYERDTQTYYYSESDAEDKFVKEATYLHDKHMRASNTIRIDTDKGKNIVRKYDNYISVSEIKEYKPTIDYDVLFSTYMYSYHRNLCGMCCDYKYIIALFANSKVTRYNGNKVNHLIDMTYSYNKLPIKIIESFQEDIKLLEDAVNYINKHLYLKYIDCNLLDADRKSLLKQEWNEHFNVEVIE